MKMLFDFFPVLLFFIAYKMYDIFVATAVAIAASVAQVAGFWIKNRRFETMHLVTMGLIVVLGGMTLILHDPRFLMWKVTAVNYAFGLAFFGSQFIGHKPIVQRMMEKQVDLPGMIWPRLNSMWAAFFIVIGTINIWFANNAVVAREAFMSAAELEPKATITDFECATDFSANIINLCSSAQQLESTWVDFKVYGVLGLTLVFIVTQAMYLSKHIVEDESSEPDSNE